MRPLFALLVAVVVVIGTAPIGAAAIASPDASSADLGAGPGPAQTTENGTVSNTTESSTPTSNSTESNTTTTPDGTGSDANESNETATAIEPGAQLAGVVAVQGTEVDSEVDSRAFGQRVAAAASNDSKAAVVAGEVNDSRERLAELRDRLDALEAARKAGNISEGRYRAEAAQASAEINAIERRLDQSNETAQSLPADVRAANGINVSTIELLRSEARNASGPEVAAIARSIGGDRSGRGLGDNVGPPGRSGEAPGASGGPNDAGDGDSGPPENRTGNGSGGETSPSDRGAGSGTDGERNSSDSNGSPQESEANRNDRQSGESNGAESGDSKAGGPDSNPGNGDSADDQPDEDDDGDT